MTDNTIFPIIEPKDIFNFPKIQEQLEMFWTTTFTVTPEQESTPEPLTLNVETIDLTGSPIVTGSNAPYSIAYPTEPAPTAINFSIPDPDATPTPINTYHTAETIAAPSEEGYVPNADNSGFIKIPQEQPTTPDTTTPEFTFTTETFTVTEHGLPVIAIPTVTSNDADGSNFEITGSNSSNTLSGTSGNDDIFGEGGNDTIYGDTGKDYIVAGTGNDFVNGNQGNDFINGEDGNDTLRGGKDNDLILGGNGADKLYGDRANDSIDGNDGNDYIRGGKGNDIVSGGAGSDYIAGDRGNDTLLGDLAITDEANPASRDIFAFDIDSGQDIIIDFQGAGVEGGDILEFSSALGLSVTDVLSAAHGTVESGGSDTIIDLGDGNSIILLGVSSLSADDITIA
ncbi:MAG: hemolysin expression modulating protein [Rickettsiales bacterium]|jgi:Ca2+-binding RTX toxin-like protein|nr:hemolysin expression modulating protein [Rickettsiales bacterium]